MKISKTFYKMTISQKLIEIFIFCKNATFSKHIIFFHINSIVNFYKQKPYTLKFQLGLMSINIL